MNIKQLEELIKQHNELYWENNAPVITDAEYDVLVEELRKLSPDNPLVNFNKGDTAMKSLEKIYTEDELQKWLGKRARNGSELFYIEPKLDGLTSEYRDGKLMTKNTDSSHIISLIDYDSEIGVKPLPKKGYVRGEIILLSSVDITKLQRPDGEFYKDHRNAAAGIVNRKDISNAMSQNIRLTLVSYEKIKYGITYDALCPKAVLNLDIWNKFVNLITDCDYPLDGIVVKVADPKYYKELGGTSHHDHGAIAFKFKNPKGVSVIEDIIMSVGKRKCTPVAIIKPLVLSGCTITKVSLANWKLVKEKEIRIGDQVVVERAGDVIPFISKNTHTTISYKLITTSCPSCGKELVYKEPDLVCVNQDCIGGDLKRMFYSMTTIGIEDIGMPTIKKLNDVYNVTTLAQVLTLTTDDLLKLPGFKQALSSRLGDQIHNIKAGTEDWKILASLSIHGIGNHLSKDLMKLYTLDELLILDVNNLQGIANIGPERAETLVLGLKTYKEELDSLMKQINIIQTKGEVKEETKMDSKGSICFTGKMSEVRSFYEKIAVERGYTPVDRVTSDLTMLVTIPDWSSSKVKKAEKYGVKIVMLEDWIKEK